MPKINHPPRYPKEYRIRQIEGFINASLIDSGPDTSHTARQIAEAIGVRYSTNFQEILWEAAEQRVIKAVSAQHWNGWTKWYYLHPSSEIEQLALFEM